MVPTTWYGGSSSPGSRNHDQVWIPVLLFYADRLRVVSVQSWFRLRLRQPKSIALSEESFAARLAAVGQEGKRKQPFPDIAAAGATDIR